MNTKASNRKSWKEMWKELRRIAILSVVIGECLNAAWLCIWPAPAACSINQIYVGSILWPVFVVILYILAGMTIARIGWLSDEVRRVELRDFVSDYPYMALMDAFWLIGFVTSFWRDISIGLTVFAILAIVLGVVYVIAHVTHGVRVGASVGM